MPQFLGVIIKRTEQDIATNKGKLSDKIFNSKQQKEQKLKTGTFLLEMHDS